VSVNVKLKVRNCDHFVTEFARYLAHLMIKLFLRLTVLLMVFSVENKQSPLLAKLTLIRFIYCRYLWLDLLCLKSECFGLAVVWEIANLKKVVVRNLDIVRLVFHLFVIIYIECWPLKRNIILFEVLNSLIHINDRFYGLVLLLLEISTDRVAA